MLNKALFLDRDGVINHDPGYVYKIEDFHFIDGIFDLCRAAQELGFKLIVATNQAGIGRGFFSEAEFAVLNDWMVRQFAAQGVSISDVYYCPYHAEQGVGVYQQDSFDRKPYPGMLLKAALAHRLSMPESIMLGDKDRDMLAAYHAGVGRRWQYLHGEQEPVSGVATDTVKDLVEARGLVMGGRE